MALLPATINAQHSRKPLNVNVILPISHFLRPFPPHSLAVPSISYLLYVETRRGVLISSYLLYNYRQMTQPSDILIQLMCHQLIFACTRVIKFYLRYDERHHRRVASSIEIIREFHASIITLMNAQSIG